MVVRIQWRDPTVKWDRLDLEFNCKIYQAYGVIQIEGDDYLLHPVFTTDLEGHDRVVAVRVPKSSVILMEKVTGWRKITEEEIGKKMESGGDHQIGKTPSTKD